MALLMEILVSLGVISICVALFVLYQRSGMYEGSFEGRAEQEVERILRKMEEDDKDHGS